MFALSELLFILLNPDMWTHFILLPIILLALIMFGIKRYRVSRRLASKSILGKHVVITGGSSGIGLAFAKIVAKAGAGHITIIARNEERLKKCVNDLQAIISKNQTVDYVKADLSVVLEAEAALRKCDLNPVFMLVNCVGMAICGRLEDMTQPDITQLININYHAVINTLRSIIIPMKARKTGIIIITGSQASLFGMYGYSIYASLKFAVRGLAEALRMELKDYNISVTLSLPPDTDTPGFENENRTKPKETQLISNAGGLYKPEKVAKQMYEDAMASNFFSTVGLESWILTTVCVGMSPFCHAFDLIIQVFVVGSLRLISVIFLASFNRIVTKCYEEREKEKKSN